MALSRWTGPKPSPRKRKVIARQVLTSKLLRLVVCALNWQALGHPLLPPPAACLGAPLSRPQSEMLDRLERLILYLLRLCATRGLRIFRPFC